MRIGIIGTGNLGRSIGVRLAHLGHEVAFGARRAEQADYAASLAGRSAQAVDDDRAAAFGDVIFWMIRERAPESVLRSVGSLDGKVVVDVNNRPFKGESDTNPWFATSLGEQLQANLPRSKFVKGLTTVSMYTFDKDAHLLRQAGAQNLMAGDDSGAKAVLAGLMDEVGIASIDVGCGPVAIRAVEALGDILRLMIGNGKLPPHGQIAVTSLPAERLEIIGERRASGYIAGSVHEGKPLDNYG
jgi:hypothetical protein